MKTKKIKVQVQIDGEEKIRNHAVEAIDMEYPDGRIETHLVSNVLAMRIRYLEEKAKKYDNIFTVYDLQGKLEKALDKLLEEGEFDSDTLFELIQAEIPPDTRSLIADVIYTQLQEHAERYLEKKRTLETH